MATIEDSSAICVGPSGVEQSVSDRKEYRVLELENKLQVLLAHDPKTEKAAAAMNVEVGHFSDPEDVPGLAHFLEHMLFLGTEKFPDENSYSSYLSENAGYSNAYTSMENTNYYFQVGHGALKGALDRFSQFFISPLFTPSATDRELLAVDSEHAKNLQDDMWRAFQLEKSLSNPKHPFSKFATGDSKTLRDTPAANGVDVREELLAFHKRYYSANRMKLVIMGRDSLDELEEWAQEYFSAIVNSDAPPLKYSDTPTNPMAEEQIGRLIEVVPVKDLRKIEFCWSLPSQQAAYKEASDSYIANMVGHEGPGSILSVLKRLGWANEISAGESHTGSDFTMFNVTVDCTEVGVSKVNEIAGILFAYLNLLRDNEYAAVKEWRWQEVATQRANAFRFREQDHADDFVSNVSSKMSLYPIEHVLSTSIMRSFDRAGIITLLKNFVPEKVSITVTSKTFEPIATMEERWYGTKHRVSRLEPSLVKRWQNDPLSVVDNTIVNKIDLFLPHPNDFIPTDFTLHAFEVPTPVDLDVLGSKLKSVSDPLIAAVQGLKSVLSYEMKDKDNGESSDAHGRHECLKKPVFRSSTEPWCKHDDIDSLDMDVWRPPVLIGAGDTVGGLLWCKQDTFFKRPKGGVVMLIRSPVCYDNPRAAVLSELWTILVEEVLNEFAYDAQIAGLHFKLSNTTAGVVLTCYGFSHKLSNLLQRVVESLCSPHTISPNQFDRAKDSYSRSLQDFDMAQPYSHCAYQNTVLLNLPRWHIDDKRKVIADVSLPDVVAHANAFLSSSSMESLTIGNITPSIALDLVRSARKSIAAMDPCAIQNASQMPRIIELPKRSASYYSQSGRDPQNINSAIEWLLQIGPNDPQLVAPLYLLNQIAQEPCFNQLRTEQQLGYIVFCGVKADHSILNMRIIVQSSRADPYEIDQKIEQFIASLLGIIEAMGVDVIQQNIDAVLDNILERPKSSYAELVRWQSQLERLLYRFDHSIKLANAVANLTKDSLLQFFHTYIAQNAPQRRKLVVGMFGSTHREALASGEPFSESNCAETEIQKISDVKSFRAAGKFYPLTTKVSNKL